MAITKKFLKTKPVCKVTFRMPKAAVEGVKQVAIAGDFNNWNTKKNKLEQLKDGSFKTTLDLETGKSYQYRYVLDGQVWENDWQADDYVPSPLSNEENSVVIL